MTPVYLFIIHKLAASRLELVIVPHHLAHAQTPGAIDSAHSVPAGSGLLPAHSGRGRAMVAKFTQTGGTALTPVGSDQSLLATFGAVPRLQDISKPFSMTQKVYLISLVMWGNVFVVNYLFVFLVERDFNRSLTPLVLSQGPLWFSSWIPAQQCQS